MKKLIISLFLVTTLFSSIVAAKQYNVLAFRIYDNDDVVLLSDKPCSKVAWRSVYRKANGEIYLGCWAHDFNPDKIFIMWDDGKMKEHELKYFKILKKLK